MRAGRPRSQDAVPKSVRERHAGRKPHRVPASCTGAWSGVRPSCYAPGMDADTLAIIGTALAVGLALATLIMRSTARQDADRRATQAAAEADRRVVQAAADADRRAIQARFDTALAAFRAEMRRLAERRSHVEGRFDERGSAAG